MSSPLFSCLFLGFISSTDSPSLALIHSLHALSSGCQRKKYISFLHLLPGSEKEVSSDSPFVCLLCLLLPRCSGGGAQVLLSLTGNYSIYHICAFTHRLVVILKKNHGMLNSSPLGRL